MNRPLTYALVSLPGLALSIHLSGCSVLGLAIGAGSEGKATTHVFKVPTNTKITLYLRDGSVRPGRLVGFGLQTLDVYQARYREFRGATRVKTREPHAARVLPLPQIDERVSVISSGAVHDGYFAGFGIDFVALRDDSSRVHHFPLGEIEKFTTGTGQSLQRSRLSSLLREGRIPTMSTVTIAASAPATFTTDEISHIRLQRHHAAVGFLVGLTVDVALVAVAASTAASYSNSGCGTY